MINFVIPSTGCYHGVINAFVEPILPHLDEYQISETTKDNMINVIFFTEDTHFREVEADKTNGINVFMTHGFADKNWRGFNKVDKFDYVFVNGDSWVDKLVKQGIDKNKLLLNGYTRLDNLYNKKDTYVKKVQDKKTILFAPTHNNHYEELSTFGCYVEIIKKIKNKYNIMISAHPHNTRNYTITSEQFLEADVVVGDFGSSMYEAWGLNKPCVFGDWFVKDVIINQCKGTFENYIYANNIGRHANDENEFIELLEDAVTHGITQQEIDFIDGIWNKDLRGNGGKIASDMLKELVKKL